MIAFAWASMVVVLASETVAPPLHLQDIIGKMEERDRANAESLLRYTCERRYSLENQRFHKKADIRVRMTYVYPGHKKFEILSEEGASVIRQRVLRPMLEAEEQASRDEIRPHTRIIQANYNFKLVGSEIKEERPTYVLDVIPKNRNRFLIRGRVWVDRENFGIVRVEAVPAQNPSIFIHNTHVVQQSTMFKDLWLPTLNHSYTDSFFFGRTEVNIESVGYQISRRSAVGP